MEMIIVVFLGLAIGSFLNVLIIRIPKEESVAFPASHCVKCNESLKWYHNIPLFSWLALGGKCSYCKEKISIQYPLIEFGTMVIFILCYLKLGDLVQGLLTAGVFSMLLAMSMIDFKFKVAPDSLNLLALTLAIFAGFSAFTIFSNLTNALLFAGGFSLLRFYLSYLLQKEALGEADIMIAGTMGALLGLKLGAFAIFLSAILALPIFILIKEKDLQVPYIPFLALATFLVFLFNNQAELFLKSIYG